MPKSASPTAVSRIPLRLISLARWEAVLISTQLHGGVEDGYYGSSTGGDFGEDGWVRSGGVTPLSCGVSVGVVSTPTRSIGSSSWV